MSKYWGQGMDVTESVPVKHVGKPPYVDPVRCISGWLLYT